jgi:ubiquinone/menaquinone biosynthesis C-methylase UbiE
MTKDPYQRVAGLFDTIFEPMNRGLRLIGVGMFRPRKGMTVLDVGCGTGVHLELYRRFECSLFGIDTSESMLDVAKKRLGEFADLKLANACEMPFKDGSFDLVISMLVLHEMDQASRPRAIDEMKRVLKEDGRILLIDFHTGPYHFPRGWLTKFVIFVSEIAAGRRHFRNYRNFMSIRGLSTLIATNKLIVEQEKVVGGGGLVLYVLRKN